MSKKYSKNQSVPDWIRSIFEKKEAAYSSIELTHIYLSSSLNIIKVGESAKQDVEKRITAALYRMFKRREIEREKLMDIFVYYPKGRRDLVMKKKYELLNWGTRSALEDIRQKGFIFNIEAKEKYPLSDLKTAKELGLCKETKISGLLVYYIEEDALEKAEEYIKSIDSPLVNLKRITKNMGMAYQKYALMVLTKYIENFPVKLEIAPKALYLKKGNRKRRVADGIISLRFTPQQKIPILIFLEVKSYPASALTVVKHGLDEREYLSTNSVPVIVAPSLSSQKAYQMDGEYKIPVLDDYSLSYCFERLSMDEKEEILNAIKEDLENPELVDQLLKKLKIYAKIQE